MPQGTPSAIPVGSQFSPNLIDLQEFLKAISAHSGDRPAMQRVIFTPPVHKKRVAVPNSKRTANLPLEAAVQYGLLEPDTYKATSFARELETLQDQALYDRFARHILLNLNGLRVLEAIKQMQLNNDLAHFTQPINADSIARYLTSNEVPVSEHNTQINTMRMYLSLAGVFPQAKRDAWLINEQRVEELLGVGSELLPALDKFDYLQRAFILALCRLSPSGWIKAADVRDCAETASNGTLSYPRSNTRYYIEPIANAGLIELASGGTMSGKSIHIKTTKSFSRGVLEPYLQQAISSLGLDASTTQYFRMSSQQIFADIDSTDRHRKGVGLEALAVYVMRLLGLRLREWRKRANDTGGAEIDALMAGVLGGIATKWQIQCKNTPGSKVRLEDIAKEVGLVGLTGVTHLLFLTTSSYTPDAINYANRIMQTSSLTLYLLDHRHMARIRENPIALVKVLAELSEDIQSQWLRRPS